jgi:hypothetical protein
MRYKRRKGIRVERENEKMNGECGTRVRSGEKKEGNYFLLLVLYSFCGLGIDGRPGATMVVQPTKGEGYE